MRETERIDDPEGTQAPRDARPSLIVYHRDGATMIPLAPGPGIVIGRAPPADLAFEDANLSRRHALFQLSGAEVTVEDLASTNGTRLNGERIERAALRAGDEVTLGGLVVILQALSTGGRSLGLDGHDRFVIAIEDEVARARFFGRPLSLVFVRAVDRTPVRRFVEGPRKRLRVVDRAALYSESMLEILLPEASVDQALEVARAIVAERRDPRLVTGVASFPESAVSADELLECALAAAHHAGPTSPIELAPAQSGRAMGAATPGGPIAESAVMKRLFESARRIAKGAAPVLLLGETGSGKEVLARYLHDAGPRREAPLIAVNCGAIPGSLVESTLFGHEKGAFTGAIAQQRGVFEAANGGTVFLDEIGELPAPAQAALLRVVEQRRVTRVGGNKEIEVDARIIAATHRDLEAMTGSGAFRSDLLYRLNALTLGIPPLRDRREDIPDLAQRFVGLANEANDCAIRGIDADALDALRAYAWPGNVRELRNAIERAVVIARGETIAVDDLPERVRACEAPPPAASPASPSGARSGDDFRTRMDRAECEILVEALRDAEWNQSECARRLRMPLRTLVYKIREHGIKKLGYAANPDTKK